MRFMIVSVTPETSDGRASGMSTLRMICQLVDPIALAAWTTPGSTSLRADSMIRATNGAAAIESGITVAIVPMLVPIMSLERGMRTIIRMMNGKERSIFTILESTL